MPRIEIKIYDDEGTYIAKSETTSFESAEESLGKLERYLTNNHHQYEQRT